jgi:penicillin amidase
MRARSRRLPVALIFLAAALVSGCAPVADTVPDLDALATSSLSQLDGEIELAGLGAEVEVLRDRWGVPHIYAASTEDLFFAQGFVAAQDRLWQLEMWRRWLEGTSAEISGAERFEADRIMRLLSWRGGLSQAELASYHPESERILSAFAAGINAYIVHRGDDLPVEFRLTGIRPRPWTAATPTLRSTLTGVGGSITADLRMAQRVAELGAEEANRRAAPDPFYELVVPEGLDLGVITDEAIEAASSRAGRSFDVPLLPEYAALAEQTAAAIDRHGGRAAAGPSTLLARLEWSSRRATSRSRPGPISPPSLTWSAPLPPEHREEIGSNNWVISGALSASGAPMLANDPHREVGNPALRYLAHLEAPGWRVIGAGEPALPGIAIGHNERAAWGLTIVGTDQIDVFVEQLDPADPSRVIYRGESEPLRVERETIPVLGEASREVTFEFSRHGPIVYKDVERGVAFAVRSFAQEPGTAPYLGSLRVDQVADCVEFLDAMDGWKSPSENMICGDVDGNIAWRAAALTPNRAGPTPWYGRLPVPGAGSYEWAGFRDDLPEELNPERGWIATANHNIQPLGFHPPIMFKSGPPYARYERLAEMMAAGGSGAGGRFTIEDFRRMQHDAYSGSAVELLPLFQGWSADDPDIEWARQQLAGWDALFHRDSAAAALYMTWRRSVDDEVLEAATGSGASAAAGVRSARPAGGQAVGPGVSAGAAAEAPDEASRAMVEEGLRQALQQLTTQLGADRDEWRWGRLNDQSFAHPLLAAFDVPPVEKSGGAGTVYANGATFREVFDLADWDAGRATTAPGQSGQPGSPYYGDQVEPWAADDYFPLAFSRAEVEEVTAHRLLLRPAGS